MQKEKVGVPIECRWEYKTVPSLWMMVWKFPIKLNIILCYDPEILFLRSLPKIMKTYVLKLTCMGIVIEALFIIAPNWKQLKCSPTQEWINNLWCVYTIEY